MSPEPIRTREEALALIFTLDGAFDHGHKLPDDFQLDATRRLARYAYSNTDRWLYSKARDQYRRAHDLRLENLSEPWAVFLAENGLPADLDNDARFGNLSPSERLRRGIRSKNLP